ncbi:CsgG/HfaB family protein [Parasphingorhabdus cellanae]|uniref:Penicillin-binding protein activator LpoB n=1 Tax=Parasphingorhabdus cellanae TaxID=2806553 RepID=A0ABX7T874_9SPHN|nr:CsgG/HfaB family protein [Parasphingorhabdus cellanae]QTD56687.1 penicillin-binding protein activator LpoB [Parasphingorhabdus cellanae]
MIKKLITVIAVSSVALSGGTALAAGKSKGQKAQERGVAEIPVCYKKLGTIAIVEPEQRWWVSYKLGSPEALIKTFVARSGCFGLVDRGRGLASRAVERALADSGELQRGSNIGKRQVKAADYVIVPDIISANANSGGGGVGGALLGGLGRRAFGGIFGGVKINKKEANVTLSLVNVRTTEMERITEGYSRKSDLKFGGGGGGFFGGALAGAAGGGYTDTQIGRVMALAYLDAYTKMVSQLGGLPEDASAAAPEAE